MSILVFDLEKNNSFKIKYFYSVKEEIMEITGNEKMRNILIKIANNIKKILMMSFFYLMGIKSVKMIIILHFIILKVNIKKRHW